MNKQTRKVISGMLTVMFTCTLASNIGSRQAYAASVAIGNDLGKTENLRDSVAKELKRKYSESDKNSISNKLEKDLVVNENKLVSAGNPDDVVRVILQLKDKPTAEAGVKNLKSIQTAQASIKSKVKALKNVKIRHTYTNLVNGFSMTIKRSEISKVKAMSGVKSVTETNKYYPEMTTAKSLTQAYDAWNNADPNLKVKGEGMVVSIIDTGVDWTHKDMKLSDSTKEKLTSKTPVGPGKYFSDKVPYGYNFAEMNSTIKDTGSMHGMHVAGIVGANGAEAEIEKNEAIQGVAPECQLLAMKVFANDEEIGGAFTDDIIAAIEDSVKQGADVINMSLGSNSGFQDSAEPEQKAIKNATDAGVMVVVSAGNSQYNTAPIKYSGLYDTAVVGSPGLTKDTLQVASSENTKVMLYNLDYTSTSGNGSFTYEVNNGNPCELFTGDSEIVDCGLGKVADFAGKDLKGKIALVSRGDIAFAEKEVNAQAAGAKSIIIYNSLLDGKDRGYIGGMVIDPTVTIPVIGMLRDDGLALAAKINDGLKLQFNGKLSSVANIDIDDMSDFTSWGPTPSLDFKPEITAPGGNIWSTVNDNKYENMSGTSMAAPHAAGAEALVLQAMKKANPSLTGRALVDLAKTTSINTSKTLMDRYHTTVPYSPRRQGAGQVQIVDAMKNLVTITDKNGSAAVALKEIGKTQTFTLNLKNYDTKPVTYSVSDIGGVLTEQSKSIKTMSYDVKIDGATIAFDNNSVTVPENGTATVNVTITLPDTFATEQFVEGFVKFTSTEKPSLVVPYIGFYGDWSKQDTIDKPVWDLDNSYYGNTQLLTSEFDYLGNTELDAKKDPIINPDKIAISPNGDGSKDDVYPILTFLRNAKTMDIQLLDKDHKVVSQIATDSNIRKNVFAAKGDNGFKHSKNWMWDGQIFNSATGKMEVAKDGQYYLDYVTKVDLATAKEQHLEIPVKVDVTAPEVALTSVKNSSKIAYKLQWKVNDNLSGDAGIAVVALNGVEQKDLKITNTNGVYSCDLTLLPDEINKIEIGAGDHASNITVKEVLVNTGLASNLIFDNLSSRMSVNKANLTVTGKVSYVPAEFKINGKDVEIKSDLTFSTDLKFVEGRNLVSIYKVDFDGTTTDFSYKVDCDTIAPVLTLTSPVITKDNKVITHADKITIAGTVSDNTTGYKLYINGNQKMSVELDGIMGNVATERSFSYEVPVTNNSYVEIKVVDLFGNKTIKTIKIVDDHKKDLIAVTGVQNGKAYKTNVTPKISIKEAGTTSQITLNGKTYNGAIITKEGSYTLKVVAVSKGGYTREVITNFTIDKTAPIINVKLTVLSGKYSSITPEISFSKDTVKRTITLDGKTYTKGAVKTVGNHTLVITAVDKAENTTVKKVTFTVK